MANEQLVVDVRGVDGLSPVLKQIESGVIRFVGAVSSALTLLAVVGFPVRSAAEFQKSLIEVKKTTDFAADSMKVLENGLLDMSRATNVAQVELARIAALGGQMGVGAQGPEALIAFTEELARAVTALDVSADIAAPAMGKLVNIFNLPLGEFRNAVAVINQLSNVSTATAEEILDVQRRIGDLGGSVTFAQSAAISALAIDVGLTAETAGTTITKIFADMKSNAAEFAAFMGTTTQDLVEGMSTDGIATFTKFLEKLNSLPAEVAAQAKVELTGGGRIFEFVTKMQNQLRQGDGSRFASLLREANAEWISGTSAIREQQNVLTGTIAQWDIFLNKLNVTAIEGGQEALRGINDLLKAVGDALSSPAVIEGFKEFISNIVGATRAIFGFVSSLSVLPSGGVIEWSSLFNIAGLLIVLGLMKTIPAVVSTIAGASSLIRSAADKASAGQGGSGGGAQLALSQRLTKAAQERAAAVVAAAALEERASTGVAAVMQRTMDIRRTEAAIEQNRAQTSAATSAGIARAEQSRITLLQARAAATARAAAIEAAQAARLAPILAARIAAEERLARAKAASDTAGERAARAEATRAGRQIGGVNSSYSQQLAAERQRAAVTLAGMRADYAKTVEEIRITRLSGGTQESILRGQVEAFTADREELLSGLEGLATRVRTSPFTVALANLGQRVSAPFTVAVAGMGNVVSRVFGGMSRVISSPAAAFAQLSTTVRGTTASSLQSIANWRTGVTVASSAVVAQILRVRAAFGSLAGVTVPVTTQLGVFGSASVIASGGMALLGRGVGVLSRGVGLLGAAMGKIVMVLIFVDLIKMALEYLGVLDSVTGAIDAVIGKINQWTGLKIPKFGDAKESVAAARAVDEERKARERLYASARTFSDRFGQVSVRASIDSSGYNTSIADMSKRLDEFAERTRKGLEFGSGTGTTPAEAFLEGAEAVRAMEAQIEALLARVQQLNRAQTTDDTALSYDPSRITFLEQEARLGSLGVEQQRELAALTDARDSKAARYAQRQSEIRDLEEQRNVILQQSDTLTRSMLASLDKSGADDLFGAGQLVRNLTDAKKLYDGLAAARSKAEQQASTEASTGDITLETQQWLDATIAGSNEARFNLERLTAEVSNLNTVTAIAGPNARKFVQSFLDSGRSDALLQSMGRNARLAGAELPSLMQGLGSVNTSVAEQNRLASRYIFGTEMSRAYRQWAQSATAAAEQATNAIAQAISQNKRDLEDLLKFGIDIEERIRGNAQTAGTQTKDRRLDAAVETRLFDLEQEKKAKEELVKLDIDAGAVSQREGDRRLFAIKREYDEKERRIRDVGEIQKALDQKEAGFSNFDRIVAEAIAAQKKLQGVNASLNDKALTTDQKDSFISQQVEAAAILEAKLGQLRGTIEGLASIEPVAGKLIVGADELAPLQQVLRDLTASTGSLQVEGLTAVEGQLNSLAKNLETGRKAMDDMVRESVDGLQRIATASNISVADVVNNLVNAFTDPAITQAVEAMRGRVQEGLSDVAGIRYSAERAGADADSFVATWNAAMQGRSLTVPEVKLPENLPDIVRAATGQIAKDFAVTVDLKVPEKIPTDTEPSVEASVAFDKTQIEKAMQGDYKIKAQVDAVNRTSSPGFTPGFASGGWIRGAGTGKSDSILARLAHGEYVMDALTVRMFGPGFFKFLQSVAKAGTNVASVLPGFAGGGMLDDVAGRSFSLPALATSSVFEVDLGGMQAGSQSAPTAGEEVTLNLDFGGKRQSTVHGSREQIRNFTDALVALKRGV